MLNTKVLNPRYRARNLVAYNVAGFVCIAFAVFLLSTQPFYLSQVMSRDRSEMGATVGSLGVMDEVAAIAVAPLFGTLIDYINQLAWRHSLLPSGTRCTAAIAFFLLFASLCSYGSWAKRVFPDVYIARTVFAMGVTGVMSSVVVLLHEAIFSDFNWQKLVFWGNLGADRLQRGPSEGDVEDSERSSLLDSQDTSTAGGQSSTRSNGKLSALLGIATGLGSIFAVSCLLTLPNRLGESHPYLAPADTLRMAYIIVGCSSLILALVLVLFFYDCVRERRAAGYSSPTSDQTRIPYFRMMHQGLEAAKNNPRIRVAYCGTLVSRGTSVAITVFIPLLVFKFYNASGKCGLSALPDPLGHSCKEGYVFLAILTGVAQTVALLLTPIWGILVDLRRVGSVKTLTLAAVLGALGSLGLCVLGSGVSAYDPRNAWCFVAANFIACSQFGLIIGSTSLISAFGENKTEEDPKYIGCVTGFYQLCGGLGVLILSSVGGAWSDRWILGPFLVLGIFDLALVLVCLSAERPNVA